MSDANTPEERDAISDFITIPALARMEISELTRYLDRALYNLRELDGHLRGSSESVPDVLDVLRDVNRMTEAATVRVLEQAEALVEDGRTAATLLTDARAAGGQPPEAAARLAEVEAVIARSNERALEIMAALEFQDLTSQKVQWAFKVMETVVERMRKIQELVFGQNGGPASNPVPAAPKSPPVIHTDAAAAQDLADELLRRLNP
jgi:chemotaxis regulatin CheY-phosphate phosphatase CheZ